MWLHIKLLYWKNIVLVNSNGFFLCSSHFVKSNKRKLEFFETTLLISEKCPLFALQSRTFCFLTNFRSSKTVFSTKSPENLAINTESKSCPSRIKSVSFRQNISVLNYLLTEDQQFTWTLSRIRLQNHCCIRESQARTIKYAVNSLFGIEKQLVLLSHQIKHENDCNSLASLRKIQTGGKENLT